MVTAVKIKNGVKDIQNFFYFLGMRVPLEISLLSTLNHPNIVQVLDVHENEEYLQLVMQRHGAGMDLFEFLDRRPKMDEPLASHLFRQVKGQISVGTLSYEPS